VTARYRNPWHRPNGGADPQFYESDCRPFEHAGCLIYQRIKGCVWDVVYDGVCIRQCAGPNGAKEAAERAKANGYHAELRRGSDRP